MPGVALDPALLDAVARFVRHLKLRTYELMRIEPGARVLDAGCGPASDTLALAALVGPGGSVAGIDQDATMVAEADRRALAAGLGLIASHRCASVLSLPFDDETFEACRFERLFTYLPDPGRALAEIARVTKRGGRIVGLESDWGTLSIDATDTETERALARTRAERLMPSGYAGRQLYGLFRRQGLLDLTIEIHPLHSTSYAFARQAAVFDETEAAALAAGAISEAQLREWRRDLEQADAAGTFFSALSQVMVSGRKP